MKVGKNLHTRRLDNNMIAFSKITGVFLFRIFGGFLHVPTTQIYCLTGAIISEIHITYIFKTPIKIKCTMFINWIYVCLRSILCIYQRLCGLFEKKFSSKNYAFFHGNNWPKRNLLLLRHASRK